MAKTNGPLFSLKASKQLGKAITFKSYGGKSVVTRYTTPGDIKSYDPTSRQHNIRCVYRLLFEDWQELSEAQKQTWIDEAKQKDITLSGWNLFYKENLSNRLATLEAGISIYGTRIYGDFAFGKQEQELCDI